MRHVQIILSAAALVVTVASSLAFKAHNKFNNRFQLYTKPVGASCHLVSCYTVPAGGSVVNSCSTAVTYYTQISGANCSSPYSGLFTTTN